MKKLMVILMVMMFVVSVAAVAYADGFSLTLSGCGIKGARGTSSCFLKWTSGQHYVIDLKNNDNNPNGCDSEEIGLMDETRNIASGEGCTVTADKKACRVNAKTVRINCQ